MHCRQKSLLPYPLYKKTLLNCLTTEVLVDKDDVELTIEIKEHIKEDMETRYAALDLDVDYLL